MGTSKSNQGLKPNIPLLPDWADNPNDQDPNDDTQQDDIETGNWSNAKSWLTSAIKSSTANERKRGIRQASKSYVRGSGGSKSITKSSIAGISNGAKLGGVLSGFASEGIGKTFESLGLGDVSQMSPEMVFNKLAEAICSTGGTIEESVANAAIVDALSKLYDLLDFKISDFNSMDNLATEQVHEVLECYVVSYIYERWLHELGNTIESKQDVTAHDLVNFETEIYEFVSSSVSLEFEGRDIYNIDFKSGEGKRVIEKIFKNAYEMIEAL